MAIEPIKGFYVHDNETGEDGVAKVSVDAVHEFIEDVSGAVGAWLDEHPEATTTVQDGAITPPKLSSTTKEYISTAGFMDEEFEYLGGVFGSVADTQKTKNKVALLALMDKYNAVNFKCMREVQTLDFSIILSNETYLNNILFEPFFTNETEFAIGVTSGMANRIVFGSVIVSKGTNCKIGVKMGDYQSNTSAPYFKADALTISGFTYSLILMAWNASIGRVQAYNCMFAPIFMGTSINAGAIYANSCNYGFGLGVYLDENGNVLGTENNVYLYYSSFGVVSLDAPATANVELLIANTRYINIDALAYEGANLTDVIVSYSSRGAVLNIQTFMPGNYATRSIYRAMLEKTTQFEKDKIIFGTIFGEYVNRDVITNSSDVNIILADDSHSFVRLNKDVLEKITSPNLKTGKPSFYFGGTLVNGGGTTATLSSFHTYGRYIGSLTSNQQIRVILKGARSNANSASVQTRQITLLARFSIGNADQYNQRKIFGETLINISTDVTTNTGSITTTSTIENLTFSIDNSGTLPALLITPTPPSQTNYSANYVYILEILGGSDIWVSNEETS